MKADDSLDEEFVRNLMYKKLSIWFDAKAAAEAARYTDDDVEETEEDAVDEEGRFYDMLEERD